MVVLIMAEANLLKGLRKSKIVNKIIQIHHKEVDFKKVEVTMLAEEDRWFFFKCGEEGHRSFECPNYNM
jgi:hypothetical protein